MCNHGLPDHSNGGAREDFAESIEWKFLEDSSGSFSMM